MKLGQGRENAKQALIDPKLFAEVKQKILDTVGIVTVVDVDAELVEEA